MNNFQFKYHSRVSFNAKNMYLLTNYDTCSNLIFIFYSLQAFKNDGLEINWSIINFKHSKKKFALVKGPKGHKVGKILLQQIFYKILVTLNYKFTSSKPACGLSTLFDKSFKKIAERISFSSPNLFLINNSCSLNVQLCL